MLNQTKHLRVDKPGGVIATELIGGGGFFFMRSLVLSLAPFFGFTILGSLFLFANKNCSVAIKWSSLFDSSASAFSLS